MKTYLNHFYHKLSFSSQIHIRVITKVGSQPRFYSNSYISGIQGCCVVQGEMKKKDVGSDWPVTEKNVKWFEK